MTPFEKEYQEPGLPDTGLDNASLQKGVDELCASCDTLSPRMRKLAVFEYVLRNMRVGSSPDDLFPAIGVWGRKPFDPALNRKYESLSAEIAIPDDLKTSGELASFRPDYAHSVPDWETILQLGFSGLLERTKHARSEYFMHHPETAEKQEFFTSVIRAYEAVVATMERLENEEEKHGADPQTVQALKHLTFGHAETFYEALLQIWLYYLFSEYADDLQTRSFGNLDQLLYPFYLKEIKQNDGEKTVRKILRNFMAKISAMNYYWGHPFYLGGTGADGGSAINELSYLILDEYDKMGIYDPKIQLKVNLNTPEDWLLKALDMIRHNHNSLVFVGEPCIRRTMLKNGYSEEEARTAVIKGCYEYTELHSAVSTAPAMLDLPRLVLNILRSHTEVYDFEEFMLLVEARLEAVITETLECVNRMESHLDEINPVLMLSGSCLSALENGLDGYSKGARYNHSDIWLVGPATAGDSLNMIRKFVFERHEVTASDLLKALDANWTGYEKLHAKIRNSIEKYGNNNEPADDLLKRLLHFAADHVNGRKNARGGSFFTALHCANMFQHCGYRMGATPDGRMQGEEYAKNISPQPGSNRSGATALIQSAVSLDSSRFAADFPLDVSLHPSAVQGKDGLVAMLGLVMTYVRNFGHAIHFNIFSAEQLEDAAAHPEKYPGLQIRVCGWNVLWGSLRKEEREAYLAQARTNQ